jgi:cytochrome c oxidase subunit I+III
VYDATVWLLAAWSVAHVLTGLIMHAYCVARRAAAIMTAHHDIDMANTTLFWHFTTFTAIVTVAVLAGFPLVARP